MKATPPADYIDEADAHANSMGLQYPEPHQKGGFVEQMSHCP